MPGGINSNFYGGAQGEYLAQYLLSIIGNAVAVPRQIDDGKDFYCSIAKKEDGMLFFEFPFMIQIKTINENQSNPMGILFGDTNNGKWKNYEIDWLSKQRLPFFIGLVSKNHNSLRIYSTSTMWFVFHHSPNPSQIELNCRLDNSTHNIGSPTVSKLENWMQNSGDGNRYSVDLGTPVAKIDVDSIWMEDDLKQNKENLTYAIEIEQMNILYRKLGIPYFTWLLNITNNTAGINYPTVHENKAISMHLSNILFATAIMLNGVGELDKLQHLKSLIRLFPREHFPIINDATSLELRKMIEFLFN